MTTLRKITALVAATGFMAFSATADDRSDLRAWAKDAGQEISSAMKYPALAERHGTTGSTSYIVTINQEGDVLSYESTGGRSKAVFGSSSRRALKKVDFPDLPASYGSDELTFSLSLSYQNSSETDNKYSNRGNRGAVTGTRIAFLPNTLPVAAK